MGSYSQNSFYAVDDKVFEGIMRNIEQSEDKKFNGVLSNK